MLLQKRPQIGFKSIVVTTVLVSSALLGSCVGLPLYAISVPTQVAERQGDWDADLRLGRLAKDGAVTDLVLQLNVAEKPGTTYANGVYQVFVLYEGDRYLVYSSRGARLMTADAGTVRVLPEMVAIANLHNTLGANVDFADVEIEASVEIRYDVSRAMRDRRVEWTRTQPYQDIPEITGSTQLIAPN